MNQTYTLELPETVHHALTQAVQREGTTAVDWIARHLERPAPAAKPPRPEPTQEEIDEDNARLRATIVSCDSAANADNASIDADLAREYGDDHAKVIVESRR